MSIVYAAVITSPTLDELNSWGTLESLPFSLDNGAWGTANFYQISFAEKIGRGSEFCELSDAADGSYLGVSDNGESGEIYVPVMILGGSFNYEIQTSEIFPVVNTNSIYCQDAIPLSERLNFGRVFERLACDIPASELCWVKAAYYGGSDDETTSSGHCRAESRGHGWIEISPMTDEWVDRDL